VSAPVFLLSSEADTEAGALARCTPGVVCAVAGSEGHHGAQVLRLRTGEAVELVDGRGRRVMGRVEQLERNSFSVLIDEVRDEPAPSPHITVVQGIPKSERSGLAVQMLTEAGVDAIVPWQADRSVAKWSGKKLTTGREKWATTAAAAAKQSRRSRLPEIGQPVTSAEVAAILAEATLPLVLSEAASARLSRVSMPEAGRIVLVVGPEGGIAEDENRLFNEAGALTVRMGDSVLRTSTAGVCATSIVMARSGRWD